MSDPPPLSGGSKLNNLTCGAEKYFFGHPRHWVLIFTWKHSNHKLIYDVNIGEYMVLWGTPWVLSTVVPCNYYLVVALGREALSSQNEIGREVLPLSQHTPSMYRYVLKLKNVSCEMEDFVETRLCKLRSCVRYFDRAHYGFYVTSSVYIYPCSTHHHRKPFLHV